ncbi:MAG: single-stranded-DNA-specific exonuclease RecJ [Oryzomonas sp.]|jgi:single-stranded-DNA-specific exonuclease
MIEPTPRWLIHTPDHSLVNALSKGHNIPELVATVLANRGVTTETADKFLNPVFANYTAPESMHGMEVAADRLARAIMAGEVIAAFCDGDSDGLGALTVLTRFCRLVGHEISPFVLERMVDGYGFTPQNVDRINDSVAPTLIITGDIGIQSVEAAQHCIKLGIDLIITDHHTPGPEIPDALAVVNPHLPGCPYPFKLLAGVGVIMNLCIATRAVLDREGYFFGRDVPKLSSLVPLVAFSTIADQVSLQQENRIIVKNGLRDLYTIPGMKALATAAGLSLESMPTAGTVGFQLAPRINSAGRSSSSFLALELLLTDDPARAAEIAETLNGMNRQRQLIEERMVTEASTRIETLAEYEGRRTLVMASSTFHPSINGIASSKLVEMYNRPTIMINIPEGADEDTICKGSCRSIRGFNIYDALDASSSSLAGFGGHPAAAGLTIKAGDIETFIEEFEATASHLTEDDLRPVIDIDARLTGKDLTLETADSLTVLEPHGMGNRSAVFCVTGATICEKRILKGKHLKLSVVIDGTKIDAMWFGMAQMEIGEKADIAFNLEVNEFRGNRKPQMMVKDLK